MKAFLRVASSIGLLLGQFGCSARDVDSEQQARRKWEELGAKPVFFDGEGFADENVTSLKFTGKLDETKVGNVLERCASLNSLEFVDSSISDLGLIESVGLLVGFRLENTKIQDLSPLGGMTIERLHIKNIPVKDLSAIPKVKGLQVLYLKQLAIRELDELSGCESLTALLVEACDLGGDHSLSSLRRLKDVFLDENVMEQLPQISDCPRLRIVRVNGPVTNIDSIGALQSVERLSLLKTKLESIAPVQSLKSLSTLSFRTSEIKDLSPIAGLVNLKDLVVVDTRVDDFSVLKRFTGLEDLELSDSSFDDEDMSVLSGLTKLKKLNLSRTNVRSLKALERLSNLEHLELSGTAVSDLQPLSGLKKMSILRLTDTQVTSVKPIAGLMSLESLNVEGTKISDLSLLEGRSDLSIFSD